MKESSLVISFLLATLALWLRAELMPGCALTLYAPFWAHLCLKESLKPRVLWLSSLTALPLDLLSSHPFGLHATSATLTMHLVHRLRTYLFHDQPLHFSLYTFVISLTFGSIEALFLFLFDTRLQNAGKWLLSDLWGIPWVDALYAFIWFWLPLFVIYQARSKTWI